MKITEHRVIGLLLLAVILTFLFLGSGCMVIHFDENLNKKPMEKDWYKQFEYMDQECTPKEIGE